MISFNDLANCTGRHCVVTMKNKQKKSGFVFAVDALNCESFNELVLLDKASFYPSRSFYEANMVLVSWIDENKAFLPPNKMGKTEVLFGKSIEEIYWTKNAVECPIDFNKYEKYEDFLK